MTKNIAARLLTKKLFTPHLLWNPVPAWNAQLDFKVSVLIKYWTAVQHLLWLTYLRLILCSVSIDHSMWTNLGQQRHFSAYSVQFGKQSIISDHHISAVHFWCLNPQMAICRLRPLISGTCCRQPAGCTLRFLLPLIDTTDQSACV